MTSGSDLSSRAALHHVADFRRRRSVERRRRRIVVHFRHRRVAQFVGDLPQHFPRLRVFHHAHLTADIQLVAHVHSRLFPHVQDQRVPRNVRHQSVHRDLRRHHLARVRVQLLRRAVHPPPPPISLVSLRVDSPLPVTAAMISAVEVLIIRALMATTAFDLPIPTPPSPKRPRPYPPPPTFVC